MNVADTSFVGRLRRFDRSRYSLPGEHWMTFALGLYLIARRRRGVTGRLAALVAGGALVARALSGRDGAIAMWRRVEQRDRDHRVAAGVARFVDVASPWPHRERVRVMPAEER